MDNTKGVYLVGTFFKTEEAAKKYAEEKGEAVAPHKLVILCCTEGFLVVSSSQLRTNILPEENEAENNTPGAPESPEETEVDLDDIPF